MLITYPNLILSQKAKEIDDPQSPETKDLILEMLEAMKIYNGLGIAAPQVGKSLRLCIIRMDGKNFILINPRIKSHSWKKIISEEGCLSFPGKYINVKRSVWVKVVFYDRKGKAVTMKAEGLLARAFQHEIDHLDGILFITKEVKPKK